MKERPQAFARAQDCPAEGCCCDADRICCAEQLAEGCRRLDPMRLVWERPSLYIGPGLPCGLVRCRAFGLCRSCARRGIG